MAIVKAAPGRLDCIAHPAGNIMTRQYADIPLDAKVAFLRQPSSFPEHPYRVEAIETHMSWLFLTEHHAYKLKKPVCYDMLDFRDAEARRFYCNEEVRLNRRLAARVYLGVVPLVIDGSSHLRLGGDGMVADWLVKMVRLPAEQMLDYRIRGVAVTGEDAARIGALLAGFYRACGPAGIGAGQYRQRLADILARNLQALTSPAYPLPAQAVLRLGERQDAVLRRLAGELEQRLVSGRIVEGHGDLRAEHVCLGPEPAIIDCLEFSRELRIVDAADETGFLAMECERLGAPQFGRQLLTAYGACAGDLPSPALINFYQSLRAGTRARLAIRHLDEERFRYSPVWPRRALEYLELAERHIALS